jgi:hypothetical protein
VLPPRPNLLKEKGEKEKSEKRKEKDGEKED